jgi:hypothetical protein
LHVCAVTTPEAPVEVGIRHGQGVVRGQDVSVESKGQGKARRVVVKVDVLKKRQESAVEPAPLLRDVTTLRDVIDILSALAEGDQKAKLQISAIQNRG